MAVNVVAVNNWDSGIIQNNSQGQVSDPVHITISSLWSGNNDHNLYLKGSLKRLNKIMHVKGLAQCSKIFVTLIVHCCDCFWLYFMDSPFVGLWPATHSPINWTLLRYCSDSTPELIVTRVEFMANKAEVFCFYILLHLLRRMSLGNVSKMMI